MTSDSTINLSKVKSIFPSFIFRQATQEGSQLFGKQANIFQSVSRSSTNLVNGSADTKDDHGQGYMLSLGDTPPTTQTRTINVVLFGETGVGKSSVINLIAQREIAKVSSDVNGCTMQSTRYEISFEDMDFAIFDTIGLEEPQMGVNGYLKAIERAYELIMRLGAAGGIHLLLFCMRGGRITATTQSNYRLFCECLCSAKVPIALVFTGLEREVEMEDWWKRNKTHIEHYGIKSDGHACVTAVQDDMGEEDKKYSESQKRIRELLKGCALKSEAFLPEPHSRLAKIMRGMKSLLERGRNPKKRDVMKVLTNRCKLDPETARKIMDMMERGDPPPNQPDDVPPSQPGDVPPDQPGDSPPNQPAAVPLDQSVALAQRQPDDALPKQPSDGPPSQPGAIPPKQPDNASPTQLDNAPPKQAGTSSRKQSDDVSLKQLGATLPRQLDDTLKQPGATSPRQPDDAPPKQLGATSPRQLDDTLKQLDATSPRQPDDAPPKQLGATSPKQPEEALLQQLGATPLKRLDDAPPKRPGVTPPRQPDDARPKQPDDVSLKQPGGVPSRQRGATMPKQRGVALPKQPGAVPPKQPGTTSPKQPGRVPPSQPAAAPPKQPGNPWPKFPGDFEVEPGIDRMEARDDR